MARKSIHLFVLTTLLVVAMVLTASAIDTRRHSSKANTLHNYAFSNRAMVDGEVDDWGKGPAVPDALGSFASDGGSPGYIIGRSWREDQAHINPGNFVDWSSDARIHFVFTQQACAGYANPNVCARWIHYNMFNPTQSPGGVFVNGASGIPVQTSPLTEGGHYAQMVLSETDRVIVAGEALNAVADTWAPWTKIWWDISPAGVWGTFISDTLPMTRQTNSAGLRYQQPRIDRQEYGGNYILHVISLFEAGSQAGTRAMYYHRKVETATGLPGTWSSLLLSTTVWSNHYDIGCSPTTSGKASIAWVDYYTGMPGDPPLYYITSSDAGATWSAKVDISGTAADPDGFAPWAECNVMIDSDDFTHVVWNAGSGGSIDPQKIFHWTDRVAGPVAGGFKSVVDWSQNVIDVVDCTVSSNAGVTGKPVISECNGRLYILWQQFGNVDFPDDCAADTMSDGFRGGVNSDLYMNVSLGLNGSLWDFRRNLTNTHTPGCDGTDADPCDHDSYPSPARFGMNTAAMGTTFWGAVPEAFEVKDALDNSYPVDGYYIDVEYVDDILADVARYMDTEHWTNNPIKWFRLPCVPPVIEPRIIIASDPYLHPSNWVKQGTAVNFAIDVRNIGNDDLNITSVTSSLVQGTGWLQINTTTATIAPQEGDFINITLNPGLLTTTGTNAIAIEGYVIINSNDPNSPIDSFYINTVITNNVVQIANEVIRTGLGVPLQLSNNGTFGGGTTSIGHLQFYEEGGINLDCDSQGTYVYDGCAIAMYDATTYYWNPYYDVTAPNPATDFIPVPGGQLAKTGTNPFGQYTSGEFVTADSSVGMIKTWAAPATTVSYMVEKWQVYSWDGAAHNGLNLAEWVDFDVPSDTGANNFGYVVEADDYVYATGQETDATGCTPSDGRFYATGLLGWYFQSEYDGNNAVNHTGLDGAYTGPALELMDANYELIPDSVWAFLGYNAFTANNTDFDDKRSLLDFGTFDIPASDTLVIYVVHGSLIESTEPDVASMIADAKVWYMANRDKIGTFGCCGQFTEGFAGNANCSADGKRNLADITKLIDRVYISKAALCCEEEGNVNGSPDLKINLADITKLIDHVYISKAQTAPCL